MILSFMDISVEGDVHFPEIDEKVWGITREAAKGEFVVKYFERVRK